MMDMPPLLTPRLMKSAGHRNVFVFGGVGFMVLYLIVRSMAWMMLVMLALCCDVVIIIGYGCVLLCATCLDAIRKRREEHPTA